MSTSSSPPASYEEIGEWLQLNSRITLDQVLRQLNKDFSDSGIQAVISTSQWPILLKDLTQTIGALASTNSQDLYNLLYRIDMPEESLNLIFGKEEELEMGCKLILLRVCMKVHYKMMYSP